MQVAALCSKRSATSADPEVAGLRGKRIVQLNEL